MLLPDEEAIYRNQHGTTRIVPCYFNLRQMLAAPGNLRSSMPVSPLPLFVVVIDRARACPAPAPMSAPFLPPINAPAPAPIAVPMPMRFAAFFFPA